MPDELEALRFFRDETPGPSTDAWNRARAAIAAARAEEELAGRRPRWLPGRRPRRQGPGRRRVFVIATGGAVVAAVAALLAVLLPGSPATRGQFETTAFVTRIEHALSRAGQRNAIGYARTIFPPGYSAEPVTPAGLRVSPGGAGSPWTVGYLVRWSYQDSSRVSGFTSAGSRVFDMMNAPAGGMQTVTAVLYRSRTWWRAVLGPGSAAGRPMPSQCVPGMAFGSSAWQAYIRHELSCGEFTRAGQQRIGRIEAIEITGRSGRLGLETLWVNPKTYLPVRAILTFPGGRLQTDFAWLTPTKARLAQLHVPVPPGFREVSPP